MAMLVTLPLRGMPFFLSLSCVLKTAGQVVQPWVKRAY